MHIIYEVAVEADGTGGTGGVARVQILQRVRHLHEDCCVRWQRVVRGELQGHCGPGIGRVRRLADARCRKLDAAEVVRLQLYFMRIICDFEATLPSYQHVVKRAGGSSTARVRHVFHDHLEWLPTLVREQHAREVEQDQVIALLGALESADVSCGTPGAAAERWR